MAPPLRGAFSFGLASHNAEPKFPLQVMGAPLLGRTPMENLSIRDLLLLTCIGAFVASATYAVTLLH